METRGNCWLWFWIMGIFIALSTTACNEPDETKDTSLSPKDTIVYNPTPFPFKRPRYLRATFNEPADNKTTVEGFELGRMLFFDPQLSVDGRVACSSCHKPEKAFTDGRETSLGVFGQRVSRNAPGLSNLVWDSKYMMDARHTTLEALMNDPITDPSEMGSTWESVVAKISNNSSYAVPWKRAFNTAPISKEYISKALAQFIRGIQSLDSKYDKFLRGEVRLADDEMRGYILFFTHPLAEQGLRGGNCGDCHTPGNVGGDPFEFTGVRNNGFNRAGANGAVDIGRMRITQNPADMGRFKVPSLRNIELTAPYMHNGKLRTLEEVLDHYNSETLFSAPNVDTLVTQASNNRFGRSLGLSQAEKQDIIAFLKTLTDTSFVNNKLYKNPFRE